MIVWFSASAERELRRIGNEMVAARQVQEEMLAAQTRIAEATERIATALESKPEPQVPTSLQWHHGSPQNE